MVEERKNKRPTSKAARVKGGTAGYATTRDSHGFGVLPASAALGLMRGRDHHVAIAYRSIAASSPSEKSDMVRAGLSTGFVKQMASDLAIDQSVLTDSMGIARSTFTRKAKNHEVLSSGESAVALGLARIIGEIERILAESGDPGQMETFDITGWVGTWLREPVPALGGRVPLEFMDNPYGQETVLQLIGQMQSGAFA